MIFFMAGPNTANSITVVVGPWQITLTDLGVLPGGTASRALAINNAGRIVGLATDSTFALQRPFWDASTGAVTGFAENFDPASTAVPEQINDSGQMVGTEVIREGTIYRGVFWNPQGQAFGLPPMPVTETSDRPGCLMNIRSPSFTSSHETRQSVRRVSAARSLASIRAQASRTRAASPNRCAAAWRADSGLIPRST